MTTAQTDMVRISRRVRLARLATFFAFFQMGAVMLMWSTSTTSLRSLLGWDGESGDASFGALAFTIGVGYAIGCAVSGPTIDRFGCRNVAIPALVVYPVLYLPLSFLDGTFGLLTTGLFIGIMRGVVDIVANVNGVQVERYYGRPIMSSFHAAYPASGFLFGFIGSAFAGNFTDSPLVPYLCIGLPMALLGFVFGRMYLARDEQMPAADPVAPAPGDDTESSGSGFWKVAGLSVMVGFGVLAFVSYLAESATYDWGQEFVRRAVETTAGTAAMAVTVFSGAQFVGRMCGDKLSEWFGERKVMCASGVVGALGAGCMLTASSPAQALIGFGLVGLGVSCIVPLMLSSAGRMDPENAGRNIGLVNTIGVAGMFLGPAAITAIVDSMGIEWMPLLPLVLLVLIAVFGPILMRKAPGFTRTRTTKDAARVTAP